jgi:DNA-binding IclR family transcriptional regulator
MAEDKSARGRRTPEELAAVALMFRAAATRSAPAVLQALAGGERHVAALIDQAGLSRSTATQALGRLRLAGLVEDRREGMAVAYGMTAAGRSVLEALDVMERAGDEARRRRATHAPLVAVKHGSPGGPETVKRNHPPRNRGFRAGNYGLTATIFRQA